MCWLTSVSPLPLQGLLSQPPSTGWLIRVQVSLFTLFYLRREVDNSDSHDEVEEGVHNG